MKLFLSVSLLFILTSANAQVWIDSNAIWNYEIHDYFSNQGSLKYSYNEDTTIQGQLCQKIEVERTEWYFDGTNWTTNGPQNFPSKYTYVSGDTVFYWFNNKFFTLYNFGSNIGDQWMVADTIYNASASCVDTSYVEVIDTGSIVINSTSFRTITLEPVGDSPYALEGVFVEKFGFMPDSIPLRLFPHPVSCTSQTTFLQRFLKFRCYEDDSFPSYNPSGEECVHVPSTASFETNNQEKINIYPNPSSNSINVEYTQNDGSIFIIYDLSGQMIKKWVLNSGINQFNIEQFEPGVYFGAIQSENTFRSEKLIIE